MEKQFVTILFEVGQGGSSCLLTHHGMALGSKRPNTGIPQPCGDKKASVVKSYRCGKAEAMQHQIGAVLPSRKVLIISIKKLVGTDCFSKIF